MLGTQKNCIFSFQFYSKFIHLIVDKNLNIYIFELQTFYLPFRDPWATGSRATQQLQVQQHLTYYLISYPYLISHSIFLWFCNEISAYISSSLHR